MIKSAFAALVAVLVLSACNPPVVLKTATLFPTSVTSGVQSLYASSWECSISDGYVNGLGPEPVNSGEAASGFDDIFNHGTDPFPCDEQKQILYRGHVAFDLAQFDTIASATLNFGISRSTQSAQPQFPPQCVATVLGMSTGMRDDGEGAYFWDYDNEASLTPMDPCQTIIEPLFSVGVSTQARMWIANGNDPAFHRNFGFVIAGPKLGSPGAPTDNDGHVTFYDGFSLVVVYNPAQNPRAPQ